MSHEFDYEKSLLSDTKKTFPTPTSSTTPSVRDVSQLYNIDTSLWHQPLIIRHKESFLVIELINVAVAPPVHVITLIHDVNIQTIVWDQ